MDRNESNKMNEKRQKIELYLDGQIAACKRHSKLLTADNRIDESNFQKVRANVCEIFKAVLSSAEKICGDDNSAKMRFFLQKAEQIPMSWMTSYETAKRHGDVKKMHIESIKLETIREIKETYMQIEEETT